MNDRWKDIEAIVDRVLSVDPVQRPTIIADACAGDADLRREVESLLRACEAAGGFLESPALALGPQLVQEASEDIPVPLPERMAGFRIQRVLGVGGMGVVYLAEQDRPHRTVALKVIKPGLATPAVLRRFEHEAEVLGRLHHPGIAQIYEAGTAEGPLGPQPFFAMELIEGKPITTFAIERGLKTRERLELLARVCDAVQHAHQQGVIHRDLKPSNVLVEASGQPKILDFGVARVSRSDGVAATAHTQAGQIIGTLAYMSPEQAAGDSVAVDTRSDVYSLGVVAYQLLSGKLPIEIGGLPLHEGVRAVHEQEPAPLSSVDTAYRGDIDTVVAKALCKDKDCRYQSAAEFAADLRRVLANEPVLARPATAWYQISKFARRHRFAVSASLLIGMSITGGLVVSQIAAGRLRLSAKRESDLRQIADARRAESDAAIRFLRGIIQSSSAMSGGSADLPLVAVLNSAAASVDNGFAGSPATRASLKQWIGESYLDLGLLDDAETHVQAAVSLFRTIPQREEELLWAMHSLAIVRQRQGRLDAAQELLQSVVADATRLFGKLDDRTVMLVVRMANMMSFQGAYDKAAAVLQKTVGERQSLPTWRNQADLLAQWSLAQNWQMAGKIAEAESLFSDIASSRCAIDPQFPDSVVSAMESLAQMYSHAGKHSAARELLDQILRRELETLSPEDNSILQTKNRLSEALIVEGRVADAIALRQEIVATLRKRLGDLHPEVVSARIQLCKSEIMLKDPASALEMLHELRKDVSGRYGETSLFVFMIDGALVSTLEKAGRPSEAIAVSHDLVKRTCDTLGPLAPESLRARSNAAEVMARAGQWIEAESLGRQLVDDYKTVYGSDNDLSIGEQRWYGAVLFKLGDYSGAEVAWREAHKVLLARYGDSHPWVKTLEDALKRVEREIESLQQLPHENDNK